MSRSAASTCGKPVSGAWQCVAFVLAVCVMAGARQASADQARDFILSFQPEGSFVFADYFGTGGQVTLEHRKNIFGYANALTLGTGATLAYPEGDAFARADFRILFFSIGGMVAYRSVWRDLVFEPGKNNYCLRCDRRGRRAADSLFGETKNSEHFAYGELRSSLYFPFNDHVVMESNQALRYEGRRDRSFDWFYTSVYDRGWLGRWEVLLFLKDHRWGGIGPYLQLLYLPRGDHHEAQWAVGFNAVTRLGLVSHDDLLFLTFLMRPGDPSYGQQSYYAPIRALLIYRLILEL